MADLRRPSLRLTLGLAVVVLGLLEMQGLVQTLRSQSRLRERVVRGVRDTILAARPRLAAALAPGGFGAWSRAAEEALRSSLASEFEVFDSEGRLRLAIPRSSPVEHWPGPEVVKATAGGRVLVVGPITARASRLLSYASFASGDETVVVRFSTSMPELAEDLRERRQLLLGHGVSLVILLLASALVLFPGRVEPALRPLGLGAYEEAMGRLRERGEELTREHAAERRRMGEAMRDREAMARAGELTAGIAHEVRNGLGTILGYARLVERGAPPAETADAARRIREECEVLETVVRRFMDFVKTEALRLAPFDLARLLPRVVARERRSRPGAEVKLPGSDAVEIVGDEELLERAFENLIRNAREAAGVGGHVELVLSCDSDLVVVRVSDDGPGLPPGSPDEPRPFYTTKPGGLGLGLPLAQKIIRLHEGELDLANRSPHGLVATVRLPKNAASGRTDG